MKRESAGTGPEPKKIQSMFASISDDYDLANRVLSLGIDQLWRKTLIQKALKLTPDPHSALDVACGTGDVAIALRRRLGNQVQVTGCDFSPEMLSQARKKSNQVRWQDGDALALPFQSDSFDLVTMAFGLRNVRDPKLALQELARVLKPGGTAAILEFGEPRRSAVGKLVQRFNRFWLGTVGGALSGRPEAYRYLQASSESFYSREALSSLACASTQLEVSSQGLFPGICYLLLLHKPRQPR
jgi:demethylmenaquinone methyltransferase/2-methoxy-6-polyprenyl-1,4-benzoquinol methylase